MNAPPLLTGFTFIFWGWQTGFLAISFVIAVLIELPRLISQRLDITKKHLSKLWKLCNIIFVVAAVMAFMRFRSIESFLLFTQWLPLLFLPIVLPLAYKDDGKADLDIFFLFLTKTSLIRNRAVDLSYPYIILCTLSASAANVRSPGFYAGLILLSSWALFPFRSKRYTPAFWLFLVLLAATAGYFGSIGLSKFQGIVENAYVDWYVGSGQQGFDAARTRTAIGDVGELKLSNRIIMRVSGNTPRAIDYRLTRTTYNRYKSSTWKAINAPPVMVSPKHNKNEWNLAPGSATKNVVRITTSSKGGEGLLALPNKTLTLRGLSSSKISMSRLGTISVKNGPTLFDYHVVLGRESSIGGQPDENDLLIPEEEAVALSRIATQLDLQSKSPGEIIGSVDSFFKENFKYSLSLDGVKTGNTPLSDFLLRTRSGHCEYFATATTLLLRQAGIPARYSIGYFYDEFSELEDMFIVRARNAHAWVSAYVNGRWVVIDTTPSSWMEADKKHASLWEPVTDIWYSLSYLFSEWRREGGSIINNPYSKTFLFLLALMLLKKVWKGRIPIKRQSKEKWKPVLASPGKDSPFYLIEKVIARPDIVHSSNTRHAGETYRHWLSRLEGEGALTIPVETIKLLLSLHNRWRFDPQGISDDEKSKLELEVALLLERNKEKIGHG